DKYPPKDILKLMFEDLDILDIVNVKYYCDCSKKKFANCLKTLPKEELEEIIKEDGKAEIVCNYCNKKYHFSKEELEDLIKK
ncbi:MAG TPA: redox-regulated molecular chaperone Hsp33, partial [Acholeplasmataceae bacterium]|nr:redox-regulated molecular chaperone Hsp33 [Acholeplasmataceae bacterium]